MGQAALVGVGDVRLRGRLRAAFAWRGDGPDEQRYADVTGWWRDAELLTALGPALAGLFEADSPTVVLGVPSKGALLGGLVAVNLGVGFVEVRKNARPSADSDEWAIRTTGPDYKDRQLRLGFRRGLVAATDRVVLVDEWVATGGQASAVRELVADVGAQWLGLAVVVDALEVAGARHQLGVRALLHVRDL